MASPDRPPRLPALILPLLFMLLLLGAVAAGIVYVPGPLALAVGANPWLSALILGTAAAGVALVVLHFLRLVVVKRSLEQLAGGEPGATARGLVPTALARALVGGTLNPRDDLVDRLAVRLEGRREPIRFLAGILVLLGLLGTFWGLIGTIAAIGEVIGGLKVEPGQDLTAMFEKLRSSLEAPLAGMSEAFGASLLGLSASLVLGFLDLALAAAERRLYAGLEDTLDRLTEPLGARVTVMPARAEAALPPPAAPAGLPVADDALNPTFLQALVHQTVENLERMRLVAEASEEERRRLGQQVGTLNDRLGTLADRLRADAQLFQRLAETQSELTRVLLRLDQGLQNGALGFDEASRGRLKSLDQKLDEVVHEMAAGRALMLNELKSEVRLVTRTLAAATGQTPPG